VLQVLQLLQLLQLLQVLQVLQVLQALQVLRAGPRPSVRVHSAPNTAAIGLGVDLYVGPTSTEWLRVGGSTPCTSYEGWHYLGAGETRVPGNSGCGYCGSRARSSLMTARTPFTSTSMANWLVAFAAVQGGLSGLRTNHPSERI
jgi:hypothetical protein